MKAVAIIQARMRSSRLPGKVMADLAGMPMLEHVVRRTQRAKSVELVVVATSVNPEDDVISAFCKDAVILCFRGSEDDVLDRYYQAAVKYAADPIVRLTADCPLLDPDVIDRVMETFRECECDYASNTVVPTFPDGLDVEVFGWHVLERAWREAGLKSEREHPTSFIFNRPSEFRLFNVQNDVDLSGLRWTVDEPQDLEFVQQVCSHLGPEPVFGMKDILDLLRDHPELLNINSGFERNEGYLKSLLEDEA